MLYKLSQATKTGTLAILRKARAFKKVSPKKEEKCRPPHYHKLSVQHQGMHLGQGLLLTLS